MPQDFGYLEENGSREVRKYNVSLALVKMYEHNDSESKKHDYVIKGYILKIIREYVPPPNPKKSCSKKAAAEGDARAHGDTCGNHGLKLEIIGEGSNARVLLNKKNYDICKKFLSEFEKRVKDEEEGNTSEGFTW